MTALVQSAEVTWAGGTQGSAKTITLASPAAVGDVVIVEVTYELDIINSVSGLGGTWNVIRSREGSNNYFPSAEIWYCVVGSAGTTITITPNPSFTIGSGRATAREFSGLDGTVSSSNTVSSQNNNATHSTTALSTPAGAVYAGVITRGNTGSAAPTSTSESPSAFTAFRSTANSAGGVLSWGVSGSRISTGSESPSISATWSSAEPGIAVSAVFAAASTPGIIDADAATGTADAPAPTTAETIDAPTATGTGDAPTPTVALGTSVDAPAATATASAPTPDVVVYADLTSWPAADTQGSVLELIAGAVLTVDPPDPDPALVPMMERVSTIFDAPTLVDGRPVGWTADDEIHEDLGRLQVVIDGRDMTFFRGHRTQVGDWSSVEAGGDETCTLRFPAITTHDHPGSGDVAWLHDGAHVGLRIIPPTGPAHQVWTGQYVSATSSQDSGGWGYVAECQGVAFGADRHVLPATVRNDERDLGVVIPEIMNGCISRDWATMPTTTTGITSRKKGPAPQRFQHVMQLLATATTEDGLDQYTIHNFGWQLRLMLKDRTTIHATMRNGQAGCKPNLRRDITTGPKVIYGEGTRADGMRFRRMQYPGARLTDPPIFPLSPGDAFTPGGPETGFAEFAQEMRDNGARMYSGDTYDARDENEVLDAQRRGGITADGEVGTQTWTTIFQVGTSTSDLYGAYQAPMAAITEVEPWLYNARGEKIGPNPDYDPSIVRVEEYQDFGEGTSLALARSSARGRLNRTNLPQWFGTIVLTKDPNEISRFLLRAGMNFLLQGWHGIDRQLHIAKVHVDWKSGTVTLTVDQLNRDLVTLAEIRARNRESATNPLRRVTPTRSSQLVDTYTIWDGEGPAGNIPAHVASPGHWVVLQIAAGHTGTIAKFRMTTSSDACEFAVGIFGKPVTALQLDALVGSPFDEARPWDTNIDALQDLGIQAAWGGQDNPAGYSPKSKGDTGATLNGRLIDDGGFSYATDYPGWLWVAYYVADGCTISGRLTPGVEGL